MGIILKVGLSVVVVVLGLSLFVSFANRVLPKPEIVFELQNELSDVSLSISGNVPKWLKGTLVRNGPVAVKIDGKSQAHWFDGLAMLHAFSFEEGEVSYTNKFLRSEAYKKVFNEGSLNYGGFASDPCRKTFARNFAFFHEEKGPKMPNANVNIATIGQEYIAMTETPLPVRFDLKTLETLGVLDYKDELPKEKCWESAHPHFDPKTSDAINYLTEFGKQSHYLFYLIEAGSKERKIIAKVPVQLPSYMHSFSMTENYLILTEYPLLVNPFDLAQKKQAFIRNYKWMPEKGTNILVINRAGGEVVGKFLTKPIFAFHHANAFEEGGKIHLDIVTYQDASIITGDSLYTEDSVKHVDHPPSMLERFTIHLSDQKVTSRVLYNNSHEMPRVNDRYDGAAYKYVYATGSNEKGEALFKIDTSTKVAKLWQEEGGSPGEPVFVASPNSQEEDDGVLLSLVIDQLGGEAYLLVLNAKSFEEVARIKAPHLIPSGLHARFFEAAKG